MQEQVTEAMLHVLGDRKQRERGYSKEPEDSPPTDFFPSPRFQLLSLPTSQ